MCAGGGGQALGLHKAGFEHEAMIEIDENAVRTLVHNNQNLDLQWRNIYQMDLKTFAEEHAESYFGQIDLVAGGVPCPPFSKAGLQLGSSDERDLFPTALDVVKSINPTAVMLENVPGLYEAKFEGYRKSISLCLEKMGYQSEWKLLQASQFGVPQLRPRVILVAIKKPYFNLFSWPVPTVTEPVTVGEALYDLMASKGWEGAAKWRKLANKVAPTLVGGSKKHGGPDLGPTRAKRQWQSLHVNGHRVGNPDEIPEPGFQGITVKGAGVREGYERMPLLNVRMAARIQGFPDEWEFVGNKTNSYRQVGNAFPPPVAQALGERIYATLQIINEIRGAA